MHLSNSALFYRGFVLALIIFMAASCSREEVTRFDPRVTINTGMEELITAQVLSDGKVVVLGYLSGAIASITYDTKGNQIAARGLEVNNENATILAYPNATYSVYNLYPGIVEISRSIYTSTNDLYLYSFELDINLRGIFLDCQTLGTNTVYLYTPEINGRQDNRRFITILNEVGEIISSSDEFSETQTFEGNILVQENSIYYNVGIWDEDPSKYALRKVDINLISEWGFLYTFNYDFRIKELADKKILLYNPQPSSQYPPEYITISEDGLEYTDVTNETRLPDDFEYLQSGVFIYVSGTSLMKSETYLDPKTEIFEDFGQEILFAEPIRDGSVIVGLKDGTVQRLFP
ncbi:hypothetical protein HZR84_03170 [Hyphobacterium sp. CCMP332]|nr:hypothetical protein HZR84_03170 [Hyphobacterium sp. CCMP332]